MALTETLKVKYRPVGLTHVFVEFKAIMDTVELLLPEGSSEGEQR